ncbi:MAG: Uma2 family endonuclease [Gammaproteobacteria bacterium]|nr:Uma2 family endonuclease [Gammaproteobacteria bacterium]
MPQPYLSINEYLKDEEYSEIRHEYVNGRVYAMVGGTARHNLITGTVTALLREQLRGKCHVFMSDMKVQIDSVFYYPDVMVVCNRIDMQSLYQTQPVLLVEVLSETTKSKDRLEKLVAYQSISSLQEYLLLEQDKVQADVYRRIDTAWHVQAVSAGETLYLESVDYKSTLDMVYQEVLRR